MLKIFLWLRYMRKKRLVLLSVAAVALSCALLIIVNSIFSGVIQKVKSAQGFGLGDLSISLPYPISYKPLIERIETVDGVLSSGANWTGAGLLRLGTGDIREAVITGIDPVYAQKSESFKKDLLQQSDSVSPLSFDNGDTTGAWVGIGVLIEPNSVTDEYDIAAAREFIGKNIVLVTYGRVQVTDAQGYSKYQHRRKVVPLVVKDVFYSGNYRLDNSIFMDYEKFYEISTGFRSSGSADSLVVNVASGRDIEKVRSDIREIWFSYADEIGISTVDAYRIYIESRSERVAPLLMELEKQSGILMMIFGIISLIAILLIFCIFYMIVITKQKDIAVIKSCGASSFAAWSIFAGFGGCVGVVGSAFGVLIGYIVMRNINTLEEWIRVVTGMKLWKASVYMFEQMPDKVNWPVVAPIVITAIIGCIIGAVIPATKAARTRPAQLLHYE